MKKLILTIATLVLTQNAAADNTACLLPYDLAEDAGVKELRVVSIDTETKLNASQKLQVRESAKRWAQQMDYDEYLSFKHSIQVLKNDSEGGDLSYTVFRFRGEIFTEITLYPGGNAFGVIFQNNKVVAEQHDGDIICE